MIKYCPIMNFRDEHYEEIFCGEKECAWWDEVRSQCCILTQALAAAGKPSVTPVVFQPNVQTTPAIVPNSSGDWEAPNPYKITCNNSKVTDSYILDFDEGGYKQI